MKAAPYIHGLTEIMAWVSNYTHPSGLNKPPLKLGHGWVITFHYLGVDIHGLDWCIIWYEQGQFQ